MDFTFRRSYRGPVKAVLLDWAGTTMGNILTLTPPLTITRDEMERALDIIEECLQEVGAEC